MTISGLVAQWRASDITGLTDGAEVATWPDSGPSGYNASQATPANQPVYKAGVVNGQPVVRFNGTSSYMETPNIGKAVQPFTVCLVALTTTIATGTARVISYSRDTLQGGWAVGRSAAAGVLTTYAHKDYSFASCWTANQWLAKVVTANNDASFTTSWYNEGAATTPLTFTTSAGTSSDGMMIGAERTGAGGSLASFWAGDVAEMAVFDHVLSASERTEWDTAVQDTYAITEADYSGGVPKPAGWVIGGIAY